MTVYVDDVRHGFGRMIMCHMWADTLDELLAMADAIGVDRRWIQGHPELSQGSGLRAKWVHFDISLQKKHRAIAAGAVLVDKYAAVEHVARLRIANGNPLLKSYGERQLRQVELARGRARA
jgi:hypothetical protein